MINIERKKRKTERRRNEILQAAERLFQQKGFEKVTMEEIAEEVDLSKSSMYVYFKNKDVLFFSIILQKWNIYLEQLKERMNREQSGLGKINAMVQFTLDFSRDNPEYAEMTTHNSSHIFQRIDKENLEEMMKFSENYRPLILDAVKEGVADGTIREDIDPVFVGMFIHMVTYITSYPDPFLSYGFRARGIDYNDYAQLLPRFLRSSIAKNPCPDTPDLR